MFSSIRWRLIFYYILVISLIVLIMGLSFIWFLNNFYMKNLHENLYTQLKLVEALVAEMSDRGASSQDIDNLCKQLGHELGLRITLVNRDGTVLADSAEIPAFMDNHAQRPEIIEAYAVGEGSSIRYSTTIGEEMYYLAVPVEIPSLMEFTEDGTLTIRISLPLVMINDTTSRLKYIILAALLGSSIIALVASVILSHRLTGQIREISKAARAISAGNFAPALEIGGNDELTALGRSIKEMGGALNKKIDQVTWEKNKLDTVVSSINSGIIMVDQEQKIELINPAAEKLFDVNKDAVTGKPIQQTVRYYALTEKLKTVYGEGKSQYFELNLYYPRTVLVEAYLLPLTTDGKGVSGGLFIFHEVTEKRTMEKMRSDFVANVSHELRTPLTTIRGYTETIMTEKLSNEELIDFLRIIDKETNRLTNLIDSLLDLAQIENEKELFMKEKIDLEALLLEAKKRIQDLQSQREVSIDLDISESHLVVSGNFEWLCQAVINILENSIRHGKERGRITIKIFRESDQAVVEISDDGPGIPKEDLPYIFERFYRVDKARSRKSGGTGLGLSIVKHIMEAHKAYYSLNSTEGLGTFFRFSLPIINNS
ncbi:MAG: ATP-binding protein [Bacillota bacterium]|nr:ATP-binding protein [Bacillota bacterium]